MKKTIIKTAKTKQKAINDALKEINKRQDEVEIEVLEEESSGFLGLIGQKDAVVRVSYDDLDESFEDFVKDLDEEIEEESKEIKNSIDESLNSKEEAIDKENEIDDITIVESQDEFEDDSDENIILIEDLDKNTPNDQEVRSLDDNEDDFQANNVEKYYRAKQFLKELLEGMHFEDVKVIGNLEDNIIKLDAKINEKDTGIAIGKGGKTIEAIELILRKSLKTRSNNLKINIDINSYKRRRDDKIIEQADYAARKVQKTRKKWNLKYMNSYERRLAHEKISKYGDLTSYSEGLEPKRYVVVDLAENI